MKRRFFPLAIMFVGLGTLGFSLFDRDPKLLYNPSPSAPIGWYKVAPHERYEVGDIVAAWLPMQAEYLADERGYLPMNTPIIKSIWAASGDQYCIEKGHLLVEGREPLTIHATDRKGRMMPVLPDKCRRLNKREYLLVSVRTDRSFDSRYFGPVKGADILGAAEFIGSSVEVSASDNREKGGARGPGAQGKIKERGTNLSLSHCLHIDFYSTNWSGIVPKQRLICIGDGRLGWYYFTIDHERSPRPGW